MTGYFQVNYHGGACCGIKHIWHLPSSPSHELSRKGKHKAGPNEAAQYYRGNASFFPIAAPQEKASDRLNRIIDYIKSRRPGGIIEIVLASWQLLPWREHLKSIGFVEVNKVRNSNSGHTIHVYHLNCVKD